MIHRYFCTHVEVSVYFDDSWVSGCQCAMTGWFRYDVNFLIHAFAFTFFDSGPCRWSCCKKLQKENK